MKDLSGLVLVFGDEAGPLHIEHHHGLLDQMHEALLVPEDSDCVFGLTELQILPVQSFLLVTDSTQSETFALQGSR